MAITVTTAAGALNRHNTCNMVGTSADTAPAEFIPNATMANGDPVAIPNGATYYDMSSQFWYMYDASSPVGQRWIPQNGGPAIG